MLGGCPSVLAGPFDEHMESRASPIGKHDQIGCRRICLHFGVIGSGYDASSPPAAGRENYYDPPRMRPWNALRERCLHTNACPTSGQQVREGSDLLIPSRGHFSADHLTNGAPNPGRISDRQMVRLFDEGAFTDAHI
jgi:hypothetical protein